MKVKDKELRILMCKNLMTRYDLAKAAKVNPATISNVLRGDSTTPKTIGKIAKALGCDPVEIIDLESI